jgi:hypothetical protein
MSDPYRDSEIRDGVDAPNDRGIVGDVIAQFADPHAFYRELVQNSIDAGTADVAVDLVYDESAQRMRIAVRDRGEGMTRDIIENQLLVLFRSSKEKQQGKIGKFGVGFASVLSPNPEVVVVNTARDGKRLTLHLYRDLTYELFDGGRATQNGTTVELEIAIAREDAAEFERASHAALHRWCRHASVPITFTSHVREHKRSVRIDGPLGFEDALVKVKQELDDGELTIVAAIRRIKTPYLGLFNHGLMLHETNAELDEFPKVHIKVLDSRLGHTISRDDVRRDRHFHHALARAREVATKKLALAAEERLRELAEAGGDAAYYDEVVTAIADSGLVLDLWHFPLVEPIGGKRSIAHDQLADRAYYAYTSSPLTEVLAETGVAVVHARRGGATQAAVARISRPIVLVHVEHELTAVSRVEPTDRDVALVKLLHEVLDRVHRAPQDIVLASIVGARADLLAVAISDRDTRVVDRDESVKNPFAFLGRRALALSTEHPLVAAAREADDPVLAATHLARAVLLQYGLLDGRRSSQVLELALDRIGVPK